VTDPLFLREDLPDPLPAPGSVVSLDGDEGRHAVVVRRIRAGKSVMLSDGRGRGLRARVAEVGKDSLMASVTEHLAAPSSPLSYVVVQALAKGDRAELACEMLTEVGVHEIVPWQSARSIVRWSGDRGAKSLSRWRSTVREAAKQSRRLRVPQVSEPVTTAQLAARVAAAPLALVLHEEATARLPDVALPAAGEVLVIVGPEGGISPDELATLSEAGGRPVLVSDAVLRTSTAGVVALAGLTLR
jgi:16S rRNA (uracil1498-N3)-methyltransferase